MERKQRRLPNYQVMESLIDRAIARGLLQRNEKGGSPEHLGYVMELAYLCRLRGIEVVTLTDENELEIGISEQPSQGRP